jgi:nucleoporin NDC1
MTTGVSFCLEISHHFVQVVHTRRCSFAPPQSTAAAETNPTEFILETLEQSDPRSVMQYLAYQDLCAVTECNLEPWRRGAFFEESGETYKRIVTACLRPLEEFTSKIIEALEGFASDKPELMSQQSKLFGAFDDFQICTWCARTLAGLTARSHQEDRYGVAQLTGCNAAVMSMLLSALVAIEACLGKKTNPQPVNSMGPESIRWANFSTGRKATGTVIASTQRGGLHKKAYVMADVLRTSIYQIVSAFVDDLQANAKPSSLEKNWISEGRKPIYGSQAVLVQKLILFIEYRAV